MAPGRTALSFAQNDFLFILAYPVSPNPIVALVVKYSFDQAKVMTADNQSILFIRP